MNKRYSKKTPCVRFWLRKLVVMTVSHTVFFHQTDSACLHFITKTAEERPSERKSSIVFRSFYGDLRKYN